jgi:hypothetical protein
MYLEIKPRISEFFYDQIHPYLGTFGSVGRGKWHARPGAEVISAWNIRNGPLNQLAEP